MVRSLSVFAFFVFALLVLNSEKAFCQFILCYELHDDGTSCASVFGPRLPNVGCAGCNSNHECIEPDNALWSTPLDNWGNTFSRAYNIGDGGRESWTPKTFVCAKIYDCETVCEISFGTGNWECVPKDQPPDWRWWIHYDVLDGNDCPT